MTLMRSDYRIAEGIEGAIEPIVEIGQFVLVNDRRGRYSIYIVSHIEPLPVSYPLCINLARSGIAAGATITGVVTNGTLDCPSGTFAQYRARVLDDICLTFHQPAAIARFGNRYQTAMVGATGAEHDRCDHLSEFYVYEDGSPILDVENCGGVALAQARAMFYGFIYTLEGDGGRNSSGGQPLPIETFRSVNDAELHAHAPFLYVPMAGYSASY